MKNPLPHLLKINTTIKAGYDSIGWMLSVVTGSSVVGFVIISLDARLAVPSVLIPLITIGVFYGVGAMHENKLS